MSFCSECTHAGTVLGGASVIAALTNVWVQYDVTVSGTGFVSTERTNAFGVWMSNDGRRVLEMVEVTVYRNG
jgi:hypothetical protein